MGTTILSLALTFSTPILVGDTINGLKVGSIEYVCVQGTFVPLGYILYSSSGVRIAFIPYDKVTMVSYDY